MTPEERNLINGLFDRLHKADASAPTKDHEAEQLISQLTSQVPSAPYLLAQTTLVQEHALANAQARIQTLEQQLQQAQQQPPASSGSSGGGFLSGLFGGHSSTPPPQPQPQQAPPPMPVQPQAPPYPSTVGMAPSAGGGFLKSALGTAAGVAGGAMLFQGIQNLLGHNSGPFGSFGGSGGGGFLGGAGPREVVNNYYGDSGGNERSGGGAGGGDSADSGFQNDSTGGGELGAPIPQGGADQPANPGYEDARYEGSNFDTSNPFEKPMDDQSFLGSRDESSLDNNYDLDNTEAGNSDSGGGGDFVGGDSDNSDSSYV